MSSPSTLRRIRGDIKNISVPFEFHHVVHIKPSDITKLKESSKNETNAEQSDMLQKQVHSVVCDEIPGSERESLEDIHTKHWITVTEKLDQITVLLQEILAQKVCTTCNKSACLDEKNKGTTEVTNIQHNEDSSEVVQFVEERETQCGKVVEAREDASSNSSIDWSIPQMVVTPYIDTDTKKKSSESAFKPKCAKITSSSSKLEAHVAPRYQPDIHQNKASSSKIDERECWSKALQSNIYDLVEGVIFRESELPDWLLSEDCLTEDECSSVRRLIDRKDQIRILVSIIKGRDIAVLTKFVRQVARHNEALANKLQESFEANKRSCLNSKQCALCQLKNHVNIKIVIDELWSSDLIDNGFYNEVIYSDRTTGIQNSLWKQLIDILNRLSGKRARLAMESLLRALEKHNYYNYIGSGLKRINNLNGKLACACNVPLTDQHRISSDSSCVPSSSIFSDESNRSSMSSGESGNNGDIPMQNCGYRKDKSNYLVYDEVDPEVDFKRNLVSRISEEETSQEQLQSEESGYKTINTEYLDKPPIPPKTPKYYEALQTFELNKR